MFYGTLEYSARSIEMTMDTDRTEREQKPVVVQMIALFRAHYGAQHDAVKSDNLPLDRLSGKLDELCEKVDKLDERLSR